MLFSVIHYNSHLLTIIYFIYQFFSTFLVLLNITNSCLLLFTVDSVQIRNYSVLIHYLFSADSVPIQCRFSDDSVLIKYY